MKHTPKASGAFRVEQDREWYRIDDFDALEPFLVNLVTAGDQWAFISTSGALTAGRRRAEHAMFPYETDDRLHRSGGRSGPITLLRVGDPGTETLWQPFAPDAPFGEVDRSLAKTPIGDRLRFEESHPELGLTFSYTWAAAPAHGLVRLCELVRHDDLPPVRVELLDGLLDVLPAGVTLEAQQTRSTLVDAYRRSELDGASGLALFTLEALVSDRTDPGESLRATTMWTTGLTNPTIALSDRQLRRFRSGNGLEAEHLVTGRKGAFLVSTTMTIERGTAVRWMMVGDVAQDHVAVSHVCDRLRAAPATVDDVLASVDEAHDELVALIADADALQETGDRKATAHHAANVLFNSMRGGTFTDAHRIELREFVDFVGMRNVAAARRLPPLIARLEPVVSVVVLREATDTDPDLRRLVNEFLPLVFSRRHGDPSRPWNSFAIEPVGADGTRTRGYEGNWRDIFQNWEALLHSFPDYLESAVTKFVNASTVDGNNPYRITAEGVDWEVPEEDTWSNIGYWGDHQIVYLHRLLDAMRRFHPGLIESKLDRREYSYADTPYRIRPYEMLVLDPKATIDFDHDHYRAIMQRSSTIGTDGRLVLVRTDSSVHHAALVEKLLVPGLAKLSNLVAAGGIWLNTQRPEWNDANNALVGNGVSVVTAMHLASYLRLLDDILESADLNDARVDEHVAHWMKRLEELFTAHADMHLSGAVDDRARRRLLDGLGQAYGQYRATMYEHGPGAPKPVAVADLRRFISVALPHVDLAATSTVRPDGLFESYLSMRLGGDTATLEPLYEMLEGQVAALDSTTLGTDAALELLDSMANSDLYRPDQRSYILYPDRRPPSFVEKNIVPNGAVGSAMHALLESDDDIVHRDADGRVRFDSRFGSARALASELDVRSDDTRAEVLDAYEQVFAHSAFTGRSQSMYKYEGLGSVYWHMVSKLLFAVQEVVLDASDAGEDRDRAAALASWYWRIRAGLGLMKSVSEQGAFPNDPHSHTPRHSGAQQPGMTGQVKEGVLLRWGELGVRVDDGRLRFRPVLLDPGEFLTSPRPWRPLGPDGNLDAGTLGFTYCGLPIVYRAEHGDAWTRVTWADGRETTGADELDRETSRAIFARAGGVARVDVGIPLEALL